MKSKETLNNENPAQDPKNQSIVSQNPGILTLPLTNGSSTHFIKAICRVPCWRKALFDFFSPIQRKNIKEVWGNVKKTLSTYGVKADLNLIEGSISVKTQEKHGTPIQ